MQTYGIKFEFTQIFVILKGMYIAHLKNIKVYTKNFLFSLISYPAQVFMFFFLWSAILSTTTLVGVTSEDLLAYYLLAFLIERLTGNRRVTDNLEEEIVTGKMVIYFVRPVPIYSNHLAEYFSQLTINTILMGPIALVLLELLTPSKVLLTIPNLIFFTIIIFLSGLCQFLLFFIIGLLAFWLERVWGIRMGFYWINSFLSGRLIPLYLFPVFLNDMVQILPFRFFTYELIMILLTPITVSVLEDILFLGLWLLLLTVLAWALLNKGSQKFVGYGV
ncbi:MAG: ABC-2 family transporter protein [Candidatus Hodarchaeota archaeon]